MKRILGNSKKTQLETLLLFSYVSREQQKLVCEKIKLTVAFWMVARFSSALNACLVCITISFLAGKLHRLSPFLWKKWDLLEM